MNVYEFVTKHARKMLVMMNLNHFKLYLDTGKTKCSMDIRVDYTYLRAYIRIGKDLKKKYRKKDYETIVECLAHEMTHILVGIPMHLAEERDELEEQEESAVEMLSRLVFELYKLKGGMK